MTSFVSNYLVSQKNELDAHKSTQIEQTIVKEVVVIPDTGWDDDVLVTLENGIHLVLKSYADPYFTDGHPVIIEFKDNRSKLTVTYNGHLLDFYHIEGNRYRHF